MSKVNADEVLKCPACGEEQDGTAGDFTIAGRVGVASGSEDRCIWCDQHFYVQRLDEKTCLVEETDSDGDYL